MIMVMSIEQLLEETITGPPPPSRWQYDEYLASDAWRHVRDLALEHYGESCQLCGSTARLEVHHRTYERRGRERLSDLTVLCSRCHARFHGQS